ncbi:D-glycero-alpha-D-manno-heptose-1,7-bisphosphate 7-phosphatase [Rossellomorea vietnamensis]|uniref:D-glycero-alpha-D-manno-heptose-1,7-bisphosphate 7-phosphatase n=1 Tax=Rossellomorea vietnamensis TaxID=218284 RepID=UPI003CF372FA
MKKAVFLDRDGVINEVLSKRVRFVNKLSDIYYLEKVPEAVQLLNEADYKIFVVTNQGGVGLGYLTSSNLDKIHKKMKQDIEQQGGFIEEFSSCIHKPHEGCSCRKPEAGMLLGLAEKHEIDLSLSYMVGDREPDIEAGKKAGCTTILIANGDPEKIADHHFPSLYSAAKWIAGQKKI